MVEEIDDIEDVEEAGEIKEPRRNQFKMSEAFRYAKFFIDRLILMEMRMNRISGTSFYNRKPTKVIKEPEVNPLSDDSDEEITEEKDEDIEEQEKEVQREYKIDDKTLAELKDWYEGLCFSWIQNDEKITISWS